MSEGVCLGVVYLQVLLQIDARSNINCEQSLFRPRKRTSRGEQRVARASRDERKECLATLALLAARVFATRLSMPLFVCVLSRKFSSEEVSLEATKNLTNETYLNGINDTLTFLPQTTPLSPAHGLMLRQQQN